jgi:ABC-type glycerol-3-phosphate transport system substrate-binding protein
MNCRRGILAAAIAAHCLVSTVSPDGSEALVLTRRATYARYQETWADGSTNSAYLVPAVEPLRLGVDGISAMGATSIIHSFPGAAGPVLRMEEDGWTEWSFEVPERGLYSIHVRYFPVEGKSSPIERELRINGELPFDEARSIVLQRRWVDLGDGFRLDNRGNELRPLQAEEPLWMETWLRDLEGYYPEPYRLLLEPGRNTLRLGSLREPVVLESITLGKPDAVPAYRELRATWEAQNVPPVPPLWSTKVQGESPSAKSDPSLYAGYDRTDPAVEPYHPSKIRMNTIGATWNIPGQWISWKIEVPEDGLYRINFKLRQNQIRGVFSHRRLLVNGQLPAAEFDDFRFGYQGDWRFWHPSGTGADGNRVDYDLFLSAGVHEVTLEATLGDMAGIMRTVEDCVFELNTVYRRILMVTGSNPDPLVDYRLDLQIPGLLESLLSQRQLLEDLGRQLYAATGERGSQASILANLALLLGDMAKRPDTIPRRLGDFKTNTGALGSWLLDVRKQPLEIDYILVTAPGAPLPRARAGFLTRLWSEIRAFLASFVEDYNAIGNVAGGKALDVWIIADRGRGQTLKEIIDEEFTPETGIAVNLRIVSENILLPATLSGRAPDVALSLKRPTPVNFALRNALEDLSVYPGFDQSAGQFNPSALTPFRHGGGVYALPEEEVFPILFYRKDILDELGLKVPETWDEVKRLIPELQKRNLSFGMPLTETLLGQAGVQAPNDGFSMLLLQGGGRFYRADFKKSALAEEETLRAFKFWSDLYAAYRLPLDYSFHNDFRTGVMPVGISSYRYYNLFTVFAPELRGLWDFALVPGTRTADGTINRSVASDVTGSVMFKDSSMKDESWIFLRWWTSSTTQLRFGRAMESLLGSAGRYTTANKVAASALAWPTTTFRTIRSQWDWAQGIPEIPGGYYLGRHLDNALRKVYFDGDDPRETLLDYGEIIDEEITLKRKELGLE